MLADCLQILPYGLTIDKFLVKANDKTHDIVIGPEDPKEHLQKKYTNTIVGRYANRIPVGTHELERNGVKSLFVAQANGMSVSSSNLMIHLLFQRIPVFLCMVVQRDLMPSLGNLYHLPNLRHCSLKRNYLISFRIRHHTLCSA